MLVSKIAYRMAILSLKTALYAKQQKPPLAEGDGFRCEEVKMEENYELFGFSEFLFFDFIVCVCHYLA